MKQLIIPSFGLENLAFRDVPEPQPDLGEVLIEVKAVALNYRDLLVAKGLYNAKMPLPRVPCSDAAGVVIGVGKNVDDVRIGDRVCSAFFQSWDRGPITEAAGKSALGGAIDGVLAERIVLNAHGVVPVPEYLSFEEGATLPCAAVTAWNALANVQFTSRPSPPPVPKRADLPLQGGGEKAAGFLTSPMEGEVAALRSGWGGIGHEQIPTVLVQGTGGVSLFALQFAVAMGAEVYVTSSDDVKLTKALALGVTAGTNYRTHPDWDKWAKEQTNGGVDLVVEVGGAGTLDRSVKAVRPGGEIALIGVLAGGNTFNPLPMMMKAITLRGIYVGSREMFLAMTAFMTQHSLHPIIDSHFRFDDAADAFRHLERAGHVGKVVIVRD